MLSLYVSVPIACFRPGTAREFWETHPLPPPSTIYGFLLAMVGEVDRNRHVGVRCTAGLLNQPATSTVLRKMWRIKELAGKNNAVQGAGANVRPDYQHLLTDVRLVVFVDSSDENEQKNNLESRVAMALEPGKRSEVARFGGLSLGESTHLVNEILPIEKAIKRSFNGKNLIEGDAMTYLLNSNGARTLPVWVDHVGAAKTVYAVGDYVPVGLREKPKTEDIPMIVNHVS